MTSLTPRIDKLNGLQNLIINGNFDFWQRTTGTGSVASGTYTADRFMYVQAGAVVHTVARVSDAPTYLQSGYASQYSYGMTVTTADASLAAGDYAAIQHILEGHDYQALHGKSARLQFWVKSSVTGTYSISFRNSAADRSYVTTYTISAANTWEKKTIDLTFDTAGTWLYDHQAGLRILWAVSAGSTFTTSNLNQWQAGNFFASTAQTNHSATLSATFQIAQVALIPEDFTETTVDIPFRRAGKTIGQELAFCQRYYEKSYDLATAPTTINSPNGFYQGALVNNGTNSYGTTIPFAVRKRTAPTIVFYRYSTGVVASWDTISTSNVSTARTVTANGAGEGGFEPQFAAIVTTDPITGGHWAANAELT